MRSSPKFPLIIGVAIFVLAALYMLPNLSLHGAIETGGTLTIRDLCSSAPPDTVIIVMTMYKDRAALQPSYEARQLVAVHDGVYTVRFADWAWPFWQVTNVLRRNGASLANDSCTVRHPPAPGENPWHCVVTGFPSKRVTISTAINLSIICECVEWGK